MLRTLITLLVLASASWAQSSSVGSLPVDRSQAHSRCDQTQAMRFYSEAGALACNFAPFAPVSLPTFPTMVKEVQEVNLTFTVTNQHGHFVSNLVPSDFTIQDNGEPPERITYFENQSELPLRLAIVIDSSDSVGYVFNDEKRSAEAFLSRILRRTSDLALVIGFNHQVRLVHGLANDSKLLSRAVHKLPIGGYTAIYDAVSAASQQLAKVMDRQTVRRAIILITDGEDNSSHISLKQAEEAAQRNECAVLVMSLNVESDPTRVESDRAMQELSEVTGGIFLHPRSEVGVSIAFDKIEKELRSQYLISYKPAGGSPDGSYHRLVVAGPAKLQIHHRDGYFAK